MGLKICTIGGGSSYTPELLEGFINRIDKLPVSEIWFVDVKEGLEKLNIVTDLAKRMVKKAGVDIKIYATLDRKEALRDADFVTTQMRIGGLDTRILDETITQECGILGQETNGPAGFFKAMRTIPVILDICKDMEVLCPNAWLINFTNPAGIVTEAILRHSNIKKVIGLCNVPINMERDVCRLFDVTPDRVFVKFGGLNHLVYGLEIYVDGNDVTAKALELFANSPSVPTMKNIAPIVWDKDFIKTLGVMPSPYHRYFYMHKKMYSDAIKKESVRGNVVKQVEKELFELYKDESLCEKPAILAERGGANYSNAACNLICSIYNDTKDIQTVNIRNNGTIYGIDDNSAIECSAIITKNGPIPLNIGKLPIAVNGLVMQIKTFEMLTVQCAVTGDRNTGILALTNNPFVQDIEKATEVFDKLYAAHEKYLPKLRR